MNLGLHDADRTEYLSEHDCEHGFVGTEKERRRTGTRGQRRQQRTFLEGLKLYRPKESGLLHMRHPLRHSIVPGIITPSLAEKVRRINLYEIPILL